MFGTAGTARLFWSLPFVLLFVVSGLAPRARGGEAVETREFTVLVDAKPAGQYRITITTGADGQTTMTGQADVHVRHFFHTYVYTFQGSETWSADQLVTADCSSNDDGKKARVAAANQGETAEITVNGRARKARARAWTTTYWRLPRAEVLNREIPILDVDTGEEVDGRLQFVAMVQLGVAGRVQTCSYFRLTGGVQAELWYDDRHRLVRQVTLEDGHRTELRLAAVRQEPAHE